MPGVNIDNVTLNVKDGSGWTPIGNVMKILYNIPPLPASFMDFTYGEKKSRKGALRRRNEAKKIQY